MANHEIITTTNVAIPKLMLLSIGSDYELAGTAMVGMVGILGLPPLVMILFRQK